MQKKRPDGPGNYGPAFRLVAVTAPPGGAPTAAARGGRTTARAAAPLRAAVANKHVVYVHGICRHDPGYSDAWWAALKPYIPDVPDENRHEVLWSDVIQPDGTPRALRTADLARMLAAGGGDSAHAEVTADLRDALADRAARQLIEASLTGAVAGMAPGAAPGRPALSLESLGPQSLAAIPQVECVSDFTRYLLETAVREQVLQRFRAVVRPLLAAGAAVEVVSHSWGTVVAYEGLRRLDADADLTGSVPTLFTVGSALSIGPVKRRLLPEAIDGRRPRLARRWVNLNARFDIVGGPLRGNPFAVDYEYLNLVPVGCSPVIPNPWCAHGSYFHPDNVAVNRDIFGNFIEG
jgi:hypothetical protein